MPCSRTRGLQANVPDGGTRDACNDGCANLAPYERLCLLVSVDEEIAQQPLALLVPV